MEETLRVGFIGLGLIGGSIAKSIKRFHPNTLIYAYTRTEATLDTAVSEGVVDVKCTKEDPQFENCDYIFLCAPVNDNIACLSRLKDRISPNCIITDVGSVKGEIHKNVQALGMDANFIGGHPMAGSEKTGYENSTDFLIENAYYILTPGGEIDIMRLTSFMELISSLGAIPLVLTYEEHDYITAAVSHLPHIIASTLVNAIQKMDTPEENMKLIAAGGFKDITRIASSSPVMWQQICLENREMISKVLDEYIRLIIQAKCWVDNGDASEIHEMFTASRDYRNSLPDSSKGPLQKMYAIYCDIYDEAGGIATIATLLAMNNINIKNIGIIHNREFEEGVLRIEFYEEEACTKAENVLKERNYMIHKR
ncbi:MAG: prephenate dehydrogenase [Clostridiales bacterium]|nr:prephenate dehydrogenase [Clostridiales bacterium]